MSYFIWISNVISSLREYDFNSQGLLLVTFNCYSFAAQNQCWPFVNPFGGGKNFTDSQRQLLSKNLNASVMTSMMLVIMSIIMKIIIVVVSVVL